MTTPTSAAVPSTSPLDLLFNAEKLDEAINTSSLEYVDRKGVSRKTLAGAVASISATNPRGAWVTATVYAARDLVSNAGTWYIALDNHTSGATFAGDQAAHWRVHQGVLGSDLSDTATATKGGALVGHGDTIDYLTSSPNSSAARLQIIMRQLPLSAWSFGVRGNDNEGSLVDESTAMQAAIDAAITQKRELILPGTNYLFAALSVGNTMTALAIRGERNNRPVLHMTQAEANAGGSILSAVNYTTTSVTVTADIVTGQQRVSVASTAGITAGSMLRLTSSQLWYYDPRAQWYKGEVQMIGSVVDGTTLEIDGQFWDTYDISAETVTAVVFAPRRFELSDLHFKGKAPSTNISTVLLQARALYRPSFERLKFEMASSVGVQTGHTWFAQFRDIETITIGRNSSLGYGIHDLSSVGTHIDEFKSRGCRRGVDFSSFTGTTLGAPARKCRISNFDCSGGGVEAYGGAAFEPAGAVPSFGVGSHGPCEDLVIENGRVSNIGNGLTLRGRNNTVRGVKFNGKMTACIGATYGTGLHVEGCEVDYTDFPNKSGDTAVSGDTTLQPSYFVNFGVSTATGGWVYPGATTIRDTKATGLRLGFLRFEETGNISKLACINNTVWARPGTSDTFSFYGASGATNLGDSTLGPNHLDRLTGSGAVQLFDSNLTIGYRSSSTSVVNMGRGHYRVILSDDSFVIVRYATISGARIIVTLNSNEATIRGVFQVIPGSATLNAFGTLGSNVEGAASGLGGTSGTDGKFTVHLSTDGQFYMENRFGSTLTVDVNLT